MLVGGLVGEKKNVRVLFVVCLGGGGGGGRRGWERSLFQLCHHRKLAGLALLFSLQMFKSTDLVKVVYTTKIQAIPLCF